MFPPISPYNSGFLPVSPKHKIYFEEIGNIQGNPALFLHGGPGGGISNFVRRFFDPEHYRTILFDQRGAGKSIPFACIEENTTQDLIDDIEKLRVHLGIDSWVIMGGSWGSTLALLYAIQHPQRVRAMVLRGIFLARKKEIEWLYGPDGAARLYPKDYEYFVNDFSENERTDLIKNYLIRLNADEETQYRAMNNWNRWEMGISQLIPEEPPEEFHNSLEEGLAIARIEAHYFVHNSFLPSDNYILEHTHIIEHIPCEIIQGRYDIVCPAQSAYELHKKLPLSNLDIVADAGHSSVETGISRGLRRALTKFQHLEEK